MVYNGGRKSENGGKGMLGEKIKQLRSAKGLTQKQLADKLFVTPQAISRWEQNEVEPSVSALSELANIFDVSLDELISGKEQQAKVVVQEKVVYKEQKPVLGMCEVCKKPIYDGNDIIMQYSPEGKRTICKACAEKEKENKKAYNISEVKRKRRKSYIWGTISAVLAIVLVIIGITNPEFTQGVGVKVAMIIGAALFFPFVSCLCLDNNFIFDIVAGITSWGFVKFPGLIFTLDLDGIIWLLTVKLAFWIIGFLLATVCFTLGVLLGMVMSIFVYPFALRRSFKHPEETY